MSIKNGAVKYLVKGAERSLKLADIAPVRLATGRWASPKISKLQLARIRNEAVVNGNVWPLDKPANNKPVVYKGQIHMLGKKKRYESIEEKMKEMPKKLEDYYTAMRQRRVHLNSPLYIATHGYAKIKV